MSNDLLVSTSLSLAAHLLTTDSTCNVDIHSPTNDNHTNDDTKGDDNDDNTMLGHVCRIICLSRCAYPFAALLHLLAD